MHCSHMYSILRSTTLDVYTLDNTECIPIGDTVALRSKGLTGVHSQCTGVQH